MLFDGNKIITLAKSVNTLLRVFIAVITNLPICWSFGYLPIELYIPINLSDLMKPKKIKIAIVDDHQIVIDGIVALLREHESIEVVSSDTSAATMLKRL